jgi:hypothetical protein
LDISTELQNNDCDDNAEGHDEWQVGFDAPNSAGNENGEQCVMH